MGRDAHHQLASPARELHAGLYLGAGLLLREFLEPVPTDESLREDEEFEDWFRVPFFTVMRWDKP